MREKEVFMGIEKWWQTVCESGGSMEMLIFAFFLGVTFGGGIYLLLSLVVGLKNRLKKRKPAKEAMRRRLCFELPDRENSYIRARLNTVFKSDMVSEEIGVECAEENVRAERNAYSFGYARSLLAKVKEAPLTMIERAQTEEIGKLFGLYLKKNTWNANDVTVLNDAFSSVLKLSAKYAVSDK